MINLSQWEEASATQREREDTGDAKNFLFHRNDIILALRETLQLPSDSERLSAIKMLNAKIDQAIRRRFFVVVMS